MPLWQIYHSENLFPAEERQQISVLITDMYGRLLPRFYVGVAFHPLPKSQLYIGGVPAEDFVRISVDHIARQFDGDERRQRFLKACTRLFDPFIAARGLRWELHVDETPFELWTIQGFSPPKPNTEHEAKWKAENIASAWETE